jgi:hypothetical protein
VPAVKAALWLFKIASWAGPELLHALIKITRERVRSKKQFVLDECVIGRLASCKRMIALARTRYRTVTFGDPRALPEISISA